MEPHILPVLVHRMAANLGLTILLLLVVLLHSWVLVRILWRVEASAERIAQMVHDLHRER